MQIQPILAALRRHRLATLLIALEIALACAVLCNACFLIANRIALIHLDSGVDQSSLATVQLTGYEDNQANDLNARVLAGFRGIPGMQSVSVLNSIPFGARRGTAGMTLDQAGQKFGGVVEFYVGGPGSLKALGVKLVAGRGPQMDDFQAFTGLMPNNASVQITRALANHLWPGADPLGKTFWLGDLQYRVVGVIDHLVRPDPGGWPGDRKDWSIFVPAQTGVFLSGSYLLRADPKDLPRVLREARDMVRKIAPDAVLDQEGSKALDDLRAEGFQKDRAMIGMLVGVIAALLLVTALGIVGLASFWVQQRTRMIGTRRALGATRGQVLRYFQTENLLLTSAGIALGMLGAYAINQWLMTQYELPRLPLLYLPLGALMLWSLGQLAVLAPARRAAALPPAYAMRGLAD
jgi:putative ABC transport system permease protein